MKVLLYWDWVRIEAAKIQSDGCSWVLDFRKDCCLEHDLAYWSGKSPRQAYAHYIRGAVAPWAEADAITRREADARFRECYSSRSSLNGVSPMAWVRWAGVRLFGWIPWNTYRQEAR